MIYKNRVQLFACWRRTGRRLKPRLSGPGATKSTYVDSPLPIGRQARLSGSGEPAQAGLVAAGQKPRIYSPEALRLLAFKP